MTPRLVREEPAIIHTIPGLAAAVRFTDRKWYRSFIANVDKDTEKVTVKTVDWEDIYTTDCKYIKNGPRR